MICESCGCEVPMVVLPGNPSSPIPSLRVERRVPFGQLCPACKEKADRALSWDMVSNAAGLAGIPARYLLPAMLEDPRGDGTMGSGHRGRGLWITPHNANAVRESLGWVRSPTQGLFLCGPVGTGKSHLAAAVALRLLQAAPRMRLRFVSGPGLAEQVQAEFGDKGPRLALARIQRAEALVLDDLGAGPPPSEWARGLMEQVIGAAYDGKQRLIVTSNLALRGRGAATVEGVYGPRVASRLREMTGGIELVLSGPDWRGL